MTISEYIHQLQSYEEYSFSWSELQDKCGKSDISLKRELSRLVEKKKILNLRKEFYLIIPARFSKFGQIPIQLYIEKLFKSLERKYYVAFYSAAKFYGASHQQIMKDYVMTERPKLRNISRADIRIDFLTSSNWSSKNIQKRKSDTGYFKISSPALTAMDLIHHQNKLGGLNRMLAVIEELLEEITPNDVSQLLTWYPHKSSIQRFGFLIEELDADREFVDLISNHLKLIRFFPVLLSPKSGQKAGAVNNSWKVDVNLKLESDL